ncbi:MAG: SxtJ family membrane protein [Gemmatimonadaceae bacterium]|nr:SxtJ family membrane protein [Gemmatimonadaceae bacterium]
MTPTALPGDLRHSGRVFAFTMLAGFVFVALIGLWRGMPTLTRVAQALAVISFVAGLAVPGRLEPVRRGWMKLGEAIGRATTPILLAIVYYVVLTPTGILRRVFAGRRPPAESYWHPRAPLPDKARLERQF